MNKKNYTKPSMKVVSMKHRIGFLCDSGPYSKGVKSSKSTDGIDYTDPMSGDYKDN